jgi:acetyl-CoA carboxylase biotin carboxyl carrier protein
MSRYPELEAIIEEGSSSGEILVRSPGVGMVSGTPRPGEVLVAGSRVGRLNVLSRTVELVLPRGHSGRVAGRVLGNRRDPVDYGGVLLRLVPVEAGGVDEASLDPSRATAGDLPEGTFAIVSPTHGMFYRRPRPESPPYVEVGQQVEEGNTLALVEVMKCFSAITYGGEGLPPRAEVVEIRAEDNSEIQADQVLIVVRPA